MNLKILHNRTLYLASQSPRRRELLKAFGVPFEIYPNDVSEDLSDPAADPGQFVVQLARYKAHEPLKKVKNGIVITADTIVYINGEILEKPADYEDAARMLRMLQENTHQVFTGVCVSAVPEKISCSGFEATDVTFAPMTDSEIAWYLNSGEYRDKAGGYAIQGFGSLFIKGIKGCYFNVVGLPLNRLYILLRELDQLASLQSKR